MSVPRSRSSATSGESAARVSLQQGLDREMRVGRRLIRWRLVRRPWPLVADPEGVQPGAMTAVDIERGTVTDDPSPGLEGATATLRRDVKDPRVWLAHPDFTGDAMR